MANETIGSAFVQLVPSAEGIGAAVTKTLGGSEVTGAAAKAGEDAGSSLAGGMGKAVSAAAIGVTAVGAVAAGVGAGLLKLGSTFDDAFDTIQVKTGATGDALGGLQDSFKTVFASVPTDASQAADAVASLNQKLGIAGQPLEGLSKQVLELSRITGTDLNGNIDAVTSTFRNWGVSAEDQGAKLDDLFRISQQTGVGVSDLGNQMAQNGVVLRQAGLSFDQAGVFLGTLAKNGIDAGDAMPALTKALATAAKDGKGAQQVLSETFDAIKNAPNDTAAAAAAMDVFGARAGPKLAASIREGKVSLTDLNTSIATTGDGILATADSTADFPEKFKTAMNQAKVALEPLASKVFEFVGNLAESFGNKIPGIIATLSPIFSKIGDIAGKVFDEIGGSFKAFIAAFQAGDGDVTSSGLPGFFEKVANVARDVWNALSAIDWGSVFSTAVQFIEPVVNSVKDLAGSITDFAVSAFQTLKQFIQDNQDTLKALGDKILEVAGFLRDTLATAIDTVSKVFGFLSDHMGAVKAIAIPLLAAFAAYKAVMAGIQIVTTAVTIATQAWTVVQTALNVVMSLNPIGIVVAAIAGLVAGVIYAYTHFQWFHDAVQTVWEALQTAFNWVKDNWPTLLAILTGPIGVAVLIISKNWDTIKDAVSAAIDFVKNLFDGFVDFITQLPGRILDALGDFASLLLQKGKDLVLGLINGYVSMYTTIASEIGSLASKVLGWIGDAASWLISKGIDILRGLLNGIYQGESTLVSFFINLGSSILGWIGDAGSWLFSAGEDLIRGMINGVKNFAGNLKDAAVSVVKGAVDAVTGFLGINSPSKLFIGIGESTGEGMVIGIGNGKKDVASASTGLAAAAYSAALAVPNSLQGSATALGGQSAGLLPAGAVGAGVGPSTVINFQQTNNTNATPDQIAKATTFSLRNVGVA